MLWIVSEANYADTATVRQGDLHVGLRSLSERFGWTRSRLRSFLDRMERRRALIVSGAGQFSVITVPLLRSEFTTHERPTSNPGTTHERPTRPNDFNDLRRFTAHEQPSNDPRTTHERPLTKEEITTEHDLLPETGADDSAALAPNGRASASQKSRHVVRDANGDVWPKPQIGGIEYPAAFEAIWDVWKRAASAAPKVVKNPGKMEAYGNVRTIIASGRVTHAQLLAATERFLDPFAKGLETFGCKRPPSFYNPRNGRWIDNLTPDDQTTGNSTTYTLDDFPNLAKLGAFLAIAMRAAEVEGAPGRPVPPDQAWEVFQAQSAEIQAQVRAEAGR
ncbi:MAG: hypothetical protein VW547_13650 [Alphaproteobacteria bacterium]